MNQNLLRSPQGDEMNTKEVRLLPNRHEKEANLFQVMVMLASLT